MVMVTELLPSGQRLELVAPPSDGNDTLLPIISAQQG
jgi:hypothetical protein